MMAISVELIVHDKSAIIGILPRQGVFFGEPRSPLRRGWGMWHVKWTPRNGGRHTCLTRTRVSMFHAIFSTKERKSLIPKEMRPQLWSYMAGICHNRGIVPIAINGTENHVHALFHLPTTTMGLAKAINLLKANSSCWMSNHGKKFAWQDGYGAFSISQANTQAVINYIRDQEKHHRNRSFEDELLALLEKHRIEFDPKYVFG